MATSAAPRLPDLFRGFPRPRPGRLGDPGLFGPGSMVWRVHGELVLILGGARALLLQIAHPLVAAGVADHSDFRRSPFERLWRTLGAVLEVSFGDSERAEAAAERVTAVHRRVVGVRGEREYRALDPELLLWVHATLVDTGLLAYERFVGPLADAERERYYEEMKRLASVFLVPEEVQPPTLRSFDAYFSGMIGGLEVTGEARRLAGPILHPPAPAAFAPVEKVFYLCGVGLLPEAIRRGYGLPWSPARERALRMAEAASRCTIALLPGGLRRWAHAREAERRVGCA